ncbi:MAG: hypothetical protein H7A25_24475 [Leptospiraceae bacterium]|nr:hypothetical protein [Leptospiraceae bacterium]MCP5503077.1 hypothetical protein [Leptospiraceae bacterium]
MRSIILFVCSLYLISCSLKTKVYNPEGKNVDSKTLSRIFTDERLRIISINGKELSDSYTHYRSSWNDFYIPEGEYTFLLSFASQKKDGTKVKYSSSENPKNNRTLKMKVEKGILTFICAGLSAKDESQYQEKKGGEVKWQPFSVELEYSSDLKDKTLQAASVTKKCRDRNQLFHKD